MMANPTRPAVSAVNDVITVLQLINDPDAMAEVAGALQADLDSLHAKIAELTALSNTLDEKASEIAKYNADAAERMQKANVAMDAAMAMKVDYESRLRGLKSLLA